MKLSAGSEPAPRLVEAGSVTVKIYTGRIDRFRTFTVYWRVAGRSHRRMFSHENEAQKFAREHAEKLAAGQVQSPSITATEVSTFREAERRLGDTAPIHVAAGEYASAVRRLGDSAILNQAAAFAHRDRPAPALLLNDGREQLNLVRAVPVRIGRVRLERRRIDEGIVGAVDLHAVRGVSKRRALTALRNLRTVRVCDSQGIRNIARRLAQGERLHAAGSVGPAGYFAAFAGKLGTAACDAAGDRAGRSPSGDRRQGRRPGRRPSGPSQRK